MPDKTIWEITDPEEESRPSVSTPRRTTRPLGLRKNPALAFSLSILIWGGGQFYNRQRELGVLFLLFMANFWMVLILTLLSWDFLSTYPRPVLTSLSEFFLACTIFYLCGLSLWLLNALQAYHKAAKTHSGAFPGISSRWLPMMCTLLVPGWGQFLNGQPRKGALFLFIALAAFFTIPMLLIIPMLWPTLELSSDRIVIEQILAAAVILAPGVAILWILAVYDALKVSLDPLKKEPWRKRCTYAINRIRMRGWARGVLPQAKITFMLILFLGLAVTLAHTYFPRQDYTRFLNQLNARLAQQDMVIIPVLIESLIIHDPGAASPRS